MAQLNDQEEQLRQAMENMQRTVDSVNAGMAGMASGMSKMAKTLGVDDAELKKFSESIGRAKIATDAETEAEKAQAKAKEIVTQRAKEFAQSLESGKAALGSFGKAILDNNIKLTNYSDTIGKAGDAVFEFGKSLGPVGALIGGLVKGITMLNQAQLQQTQNLLDTKNELIKIGGAGAHTTESIYKMAREADLNSETLSRMTKPIKDLGSNIMVLGATAGDSQKEFAKLIKATDEERAAFMRLGISQEEMMKGSADYVALQAMSGRMTKSELQDREKLRKASQDYQLNLLDLAAITGKDVAELKEKQKEMANDAQLQIDNIQKRRKAQKLEDEAKQAEQAGDTTRAKALRTSAQQLEDEVKNRGMLIDGLGDAPDALKKGIKEIMTTGSLSGENARILAKMGMTGEAERLVKAMKSGAMTQEQAAIEAGKAKDKYVKQQGEMYDTMGDSLKFSEDLRKSQGQTGEAIKFYLEGSAKEAEGGYEAAIRKAQADRKAAQAAGQDKPSDLAAMAQNATIAVTGKMDDLVKATNPLIGEFNFLKGAVVAITAAAGAAAIALGALGVKKTLSGAAGMMGGGGGGLPSMMGGLTGGAKAPAGGGAGAAGVLQGIGGGGGNLLEGAAKGLKAFANPQVALGAAGFGAAIGLVGAGLAGATWLMGKALPTLSEGLESFTKLDGQKLKATGEGIYEIGKGMAVFGVGGAAAGIGGILGNMSEGITKFFGGSTPIDKLQQFSQLNIDPKKTKENAEAFTAFSEAMSKYKGGADTSVASAISSNVVSFMGGDNDAAFTKFAKFSKIDVGDPNKVKKNAEAFVSFSNAMADYKGGPELRNMADNMIGGLTKMFGGDTVTDKFVKFTKLDVDPERAGKLAEAFSKYANAMTTTAGGAGGGGAAGGGGTAGAAKPVVARASGGGTSASMPTSGGASSGGGSAPPVQASSARSSGGRDSGDISKTPSPDSKAPPTMAKASGKGGSMTEQEAKEMTKRHEGVRYEPYKDSLGLWTVGVGHLIGDGKSLPPEWNRTFSEKEVMDLYDKDYEKHKKQAQSNVPGFSKYDSVGQSALIDLTFNMGPGWPKKFPNTSKKLAAGDTEGAAAGLTDSLWYQQVKSRGPTIVDMVRNSKVSARDGGLATGPESGYPATLHGNEVIVPLDANSILAELGKKSATQIQSELKEKTNKVESTTGESSKELVAINQAMMEMMSTKLDAMIDKLDSSNNTQSKILKYSQA